MGGNISSNTMRMREGNLALLICRLVMVIVLLAFAMNLSDVAPVLAFHNDSTFSCYGCHNEKGPSDHIYNLIGTDQSSTCLRCHQRNSKLDTGNHYISTPETSLSTGEPPLELTPGGDFGWLKKNYIWKYDYGQTEYSIGEEHGHNIIAADYNYEASAAHATAPGGAYPSSALNCCSCHDPHGTYRRNADGSITTEGAPIMASGSYDDSPDPDINNSVSVYRMLAGIGYQPKSLIESNPFTKDPPAAVAPRNDNRPETSTQTRVAYGSGMAEWCKNCHANYNSKSNHPAGNNVKMNALVMAAYNNYLPGESPMKSYLTLTPFEMGYSDYNQLKALATTDDSQLKGPVSANVSCLTCHRAHASAWNHGLRFNYMAKLTTTKDANDNASYPDPERDPTNAQGRTTAETRKAYYDREATKFGAHRGNLCSKCHAKE